MQELLIVYTLGSFHYTRFSDKIPDMSLTTAQVSHIAKLSRLNLTEDETEKFRTQMTGILEYIKKLDEIDTSQVEPTVNTTGIENRTRPDIIGDSFTNKQATANAASHNNSFFIVPNVFE